MASHSPAIFGCKGVRVGILSSSLRHHPLTHPSYPPLILEPLFHYYQDLPSHDFSPSLPANPPLSYTFTTIHTAGNTTTYTSITITNTIHNSHQHHHDHTPFLPPTSAQGTLLLPLLSPSTNTTKIPHFFHGHDRKSCLFYGSFFPSPTPLPSSGYLLRVWSY